MDQATDLELEFTKLVEEMRAKVNDLQKSSQLSSKDASILQNMISERIYFPSSSSDEEWYSSSEAWTPSGCSY
jgi:hypothetical protein